MESSFFSPRKLKAHQRSVSQTLLHVLIRTLLPLIALGLSLLFPKLSTITFFIGGILGSLISIVVPSLCYWKIFRCELSTFFLTWPISIYAFYYALSQTLID